MRTTARRILVPFLVGLGVLIPARATSQVPFDITRTDLMEVDTAAFRWRSLRTSVGGVEAELSYRRPGATEGECRAVALLGGLRMRNRYVRLREEQPLSLSLALRCGDGYRGVLRYDGVVVTLELRDAVTGELVYRGRRRGLP